MRKFLSKFKAYRYFVLYTFVIVYTIKMILDNTYDYFDNIRYDFKHRVMSDYRIIKNKMDSLDWN